MPGLESTSVSKTIFSGPFVHCTSLGELDICESGAIGVDEDGIIAFVDRDVKFEALDEVVKKHGWDDCKVVRIYDSGFFFPGFIGKHVILTITLQIYPPFPTIEAVKIDLKYETPFNQYYMMSIEHS